MQYHKTIWSEWSVALRLCGADIGTELLLLHGQIQDHVLMILNNFKLLLQLTKFRILITINLIYIMINSVIIWIPTPISKQIQKGCAQML